MQIPSMWNRVGAPNPPLFILSSPCVLPPVDLGEDKPRTVCSGLVAHVPMDSMSNRLVVILCNV